MSANTPHARRAQAVVLGHRHKIAWENAIASCVCSLASFPTAAVLLVDMWKIERNLVKED